MNIRKVVIPVAGWGTRSLPASKNIPKEMLPIFNKPVIQYVVEEAMVSGIKDVIFVTNRDKSVIEDHFDYNLQLENVLERAGKLDLLAQVRFVAEMVCDRIAACQTYQKEKYTDASALNYYLQGTDRHYLHPETAAQLESYLTWVRDEGIDRAFARIREDLRQRSF